MASYYIFSFIWLLALSDVHGRAPSKILNGTQASEQEFKYLVSVHKYGFHKCGGAVIGQKHILLAAQCVFETLPVNLTVYAGVSDLLSSFAAIRRVIRIIVHPSYNPPQPNLVNIANDIAVLMLNEYLPTIDRVTILLLPRGNVKIRAVSKFAGWGHTVSEGGLPTPYLQKTTFVVLRPGQCDIFSRLEGPGAFCAMNVKRLTAACEGDSGGPLVTGQTVHGIASITRCNTSRPSLFTRVSQYKKFIQRAMLNGSNN